MLFALALIGSCARVERPELRCAVGDREIAEVLSSDEGRWYGLRWRSEAGYETEDCLFERMGKFSCLIFDYSCSGIACDGQSYSITGIWKVEKGLLIQENRGGFGRELDIREFSCAAFHKVSFADGSRFFKKRWRRDTDV
jgi:hypothetical protein